MSGPEERQRAVDLCFTTPMTTAQVVEHLGHPTRQCLERWLAKDPRYAGHMAKPIIPLETGTKAIEPVPSGMRGSGPPNGSARASERSTTRSRRIARAVWPRCGPKTGTPAKPTSQRRDGIGTPATRRPCAAGSRSRNRGNAVMREVAEVAEKDPGAGLRRLSNREKTLPVDRPRPTCSPGSMTCLPGIAPSGHLLPPRQARG